MRLRYDYRWEWVGFVLVVGVLLFLALNMA